NTFNDTTVNNLKINKSNLFDRLTHTSLTDNLKKYDDQPMCKFCYQSNGQLISPCSCKGSIKFVHYQCLKRWRLKKQLKEIKYCEQCYEEYKIQDDYKISKRVINIITLGFIAIIILTFNIFVNLLIESTAILLEEIRVTNLHHHYHYDNYDTFLVSDEKREGECCPINCSSVNNTGVKTTSLNTETMKS
ncbi:Protein involved in mRNA turnover and stability, partial [Pseudoloma neurophilia]